MIQVFSASLTARLNDRIVVDLSSEGSKEWEGKLLGGLVMDNVIRSRASLACEGS